MLKPFQILWELIEFALQALFIYVLAVILCIGLIAYVIVDSKSSSEPEVQVEYIYEKVIIEKEVKKTREKQCDRIAGCRVLEDGSVEY